MDISTVNLRRDFFPGYISTVSAVLRRQYQRIFHQCTGSTRMGSVQQPLGPAIRPGPGRPHQTVPLIGNPLLPHQSGGRGGNANEPCLSLTLSTSTNSVDDLIEYNFGT